MLSALQVQDVDKNINQMKTGWKLTIEAVAFDPLGARIHAEKVLKFMADHPANMAGTEVGGLSGSASAKWEKIALPDVDEGENL